MTDPGTGRTYWWNKATGQTTALGDPKPDGFRAPEPSRPKPLPAALAKPRGALPAGWREATDPASGAAYYYH